MKRRFAVLTVVVAFVLCLTGCSARNESGGTDSTAPKPTPSTIPGDNLPQNDANEGGGAGGTNDSGNGMNGDNNSMHSNNPGAGSNGQNGSGNGTNHDDGVLDNAGDAVGDLIEGVGNGVGDAIDDVGNAVRNSGRAIDRTTRHN